ncbi:hypothetical protein PRIC2_007677 [Phytophthora ramorum]
MDPMDLLTSGFTTAYTEEKPRQLETQQQWEQEEKREDNPSSSSSASSDDEPEQDLDFPTTQVLVPDAEEATAAVKNPPRSPTGHSVACQVPQLSC